MKVLLMMPPMTIDENYANLKTAAANMPSIGLAYIYSAFEEAGCEVAFQDYQCRMATVNEIIDYIKAEQFDLVGMQTYVTNINRCLAIAELIKEACPETRIILGGPHATIFPNMIIDHPAVDYLAISEAEFTVQELVACLKEGREPKDVMGLYYKDEEGRIHKNKRRPFCKDIDELPTPRYTIFDAANYFPAVHIRGKHVHNMITSRGCPYKCTFCSATEVYGNKYRYQSIERTIAEMRFLKEELGVDSLQIYDDNFTTNRKRTKELCRRMIEEDLGLQWVCYTRADAIGDEEMLKLMKKAGCYMIVVGIENANPRILELIRKELDLDVARKNLELARKVKINVLSSFMIGLPSETIEEIENSIQFSKELALTYATYPIFTPYPGTPIRKDAEEYGVILEENLDRFSRWGDGVYSSNGIEPQEYRRLQRKAFRHFYLRPKTLLKLAKEFMLLPTRRKYKFIRGWLEVLLP